MPRKPTTPIHLLIGKRELLPLPASPTQIANPQNPANPYDPTDPNFKPYCNWQDLTNFWVSINPQSGMVATAENGFAPIDPNPYYPNPNFSSAQNSNGYGSYFDLLQARQLAIQSMRMGGR
jgi:hypothetical protein